MKTVSIVVPCYNEEENVEPLSQAIISIFEKELPDYRYELIFIDNDSADSTRDIIRRLCAGNPDIKGIFNAKNFGQFNSPYYGMLQSTGDCTILMAADFQDPVEMIPKLSLIHISSSRYRTGNNRRRHNNANPRLLPPSRLFRRIQCRLHSC